MMNQQNSDKELLSHKDDERKLLKLAAKAAEIDVMEDQNHGLLVNGFIWNPLTDDGDALRLAVKLRITVAYDAWADGETVKGLTWKVYTSENIFNTDAYSGTRLAIVRAAAEIGKVM